MVYILEGTRVFVWEKKEDKDNFMEKYLARGDCSNISGRGKKGRTKVEGRGRLEGEGSGLQCLVRGECGIIRRLGRPNNLFR